MKRLMLTMSIAIAAGLSSPFLVEAQVSTPVVGVTQPESDPPVSQTTPDLLATTSTTTKTEVSPTQHLEDGKRALNAVSTGALNSDAREKLAQLRKAFDGMASSYATAAPASGDPQDEVTPIEWQNQFLNVELYLSYMIGGGSTTASQPIAGVRATAGSTGGTGARPVPVVGDLHHPAKNAAGIEPGDGLKDLDPTVRAELQLFRLQVELFYVSATLD